MLEHELEHKPMLQSTPGLDDSVIVISPSPKREPSCINISDSFQVRLVRDVFDIDKLVQYGISMSKKIWGKKDETHLFT